MGQIVEYKLTYTDRSNHVHTKIMKGQVNEVVEAAMLMDEELMDKYDDIDYRKYREDKERKAGREDQDRDAK